MLNNFEYKPASISVSQPILDLKKVFEEAMDDDLNTPIALRVLHKLAKLVNSWIAERDLKLAEAGLKNFIELSNILGLKYESKRLVLTRRIRELLKEREQARRVGDWVKADRIRDILRSEGVILADTPSGVRVIID